MSEATEQQDTKKPRAKTPALVKGVILQDDCFSSVGRHMKGDKVELLEDDVTALEKNGFIARI